MRREFEVVKEIAVLRTAETGWTLEFNLVSWYRKEQKYDIRWWSPGKERVGKGLALSNEDINNLGILLKQLQDVKVGHQ
ncbi:hypothetical protein H7992_05035 [Sporosarcina sp. resist]|uniref:YdbC family protein n=1 Tax=Sporosarcina sp. resist TaxID=2762563 RepID=UPI00164DA298|nr:PC4/YdbC family ssDNA-binding protein [Sporosarcina sp. resist]QNK89093.1 hypothetical protein H7992_05035 [Sporosarcina sp. resist]